MKYQIEVTILKEINAFLQRNASGPMVHISSTCSVAQILKKIVFCFK